ncbi:PspA/IM30 family protein [Fulvimarina sp. MAC8]|uniref:PspA/IM30 family protein n=1 Tax=Fulvimarina sp. MAC8 TaxID=3162874 RepID=UPI0032F08F93
MLKSLMTLLRGTANDRRESIVDANAITILRQQIRDVSATVKSAKVAEARACAENRREKRRRDAISGQIADLEERAVAAIRQSNEALAAEAAEAIGRLEADREASDKAIAVIEAELARLQRAITRSETRIRDLERGLRLADATRRSVSLRLADPAAPHLATLSEAEATLARLLRGQEDDLTIADRLDPDEEIDPGERLTEKLASAGCGPAAPHSTESVLSRLRQRAGTAA